MNRRWIESGIVEELDSRQESFLKIVEEGIREYYRKEERPLNLSLLARICRCNHGQALSAVRLLANTIGENEEEPPIYYTRTRTRIGFKKPYRIILRSHS